jgi:hypothetical protein
MDALYDALGGFDAILSVCRRWHQLCVANPPSCTRAPVSAVEAAMALLDGFYAQFREPRGVLGALVGHLMAWKNGTRSR